MMCVDTGCKWVWYMLVVCACCNCWLHWLLDGWFWSTGWSHIDVPCGEGPFSIKGWSKMISFLIYTTACVYEFHCHCKVHLEKSHSVTAGLHWHTFELECCKGQSDCAVHQWDITWPEWVREGSFLSTVVEDWMLCKCFCKVLMNWLSTKEIFWSISSRNGLGVHFEAVSRRVQPKLNFNTVYEGFSKISDIMWHIVAFNRMTPPQQYLKDQTIELCGCWFSKAAFLKNPWKAQFLDSVKLSCVQKWLIGSVS